MMYEEHAEHARQHETLRAAVAGFVIALVAGLLALTGESRLTVGLLVCAVSLLGAFLNQKHSERFDLHKAVLSGFREALETGVSPTFSKINNACRDKHEAEHPFMDWVRLRYLWLVIYIITFLIGAVFAITAKVG